MTPRRHIVLDLVIVLIAGLTLLVAWMPTSAHAAVVNGQQDCVNVTQIPVLDTDKDGFSDYEECNGITISVTGVTLAGYTSRGILSREKYLNPNEQDVVIFLFPALSGSLIPARSTGSLYHPFDIVSTLGVVPHVFTNSSQTPLGLNGVAVSQSNRAVTATQKGVVVFEDLSTSAIAMGKSQWGGPNLVTDVDTRIYTQKIFCFVQQQYTGLTSCNLQTAPTSFSDQYILRTFNHEVSHVLALTNHYDSTLQNHYKDTAAYLMNKNVTVTKKGTTITWSIPTAYTSSEPQQDCYNVSVLDISTNNGVCQ